LIPDWILERRLKFKSPVYTQEIFQDDLFGMIFDDAVDVA
jgi:hypothetical protein